MSNPDIIFRADYESPKDDSLEEDEDEEDSFDEDDE